ncbi:MAG: hypothetical protein IIU30_11065, partial [Treponema sp.]|nr:hypothetical protein [Treponema sp.]
DYALCRTEAEDTIGSREGSARRKTMQLMQVGLAVVVELSSRKGPLVHLPWNDRNRGNSPNDFWHGLS